MTKKDFQLIAAVLANASPLHKCETDFRNALAVDFANALNGTNPRFKRDLFIQAATGQVKATARKARVSDAELRASAIARATPRTLTSDRAEDR